MDRRGWSSDMRLKLRILFIVILVQTALTMVVGSVSTSQVTYFGVTHFRPAVMPE